MPTEIRMPALSPTMEKGTLAKWFVKEGDVVAAGDIIAEIETDKATMEFEAADDGRIAQILVEEGTDDVLVGAVIALVGEDVGQVSGQTGVSAKAPRALVSAAADAPSIRAPEPAPVEPRHDPVIERPFARLADKIKISPLAARIVEAKGLDLSGISGSGPGGRIVKADLNLKRPESPSPAAVTAYVAPEAIVLPIPDIPHELTKLSAMRKTIARRLTESKQQVPHIYLTVDVTLDPLLKLRTQLNETLAPRGIKLSINDMIIKALALALIEVPQCNVQFAGDQLVKFQRADISVAVSIPNGLITPVVKNADGKSLSAIATEIKNLAERARDGKLLPEEYQGGTASLSNLGMFGIRQFDAVINPPQAMIMAVGKGERRAIVLDDTVTVATVMCATGSFDHRAVDGADAAKLMQAFQRILENPLEVLG
ncbi:MAG TPA: pyruvate dehydrogenase complex dihydrolipoamide acetyltransferase [Sphingobium sp.]